MLVLTIDSGDSIVFTSPNGEAVELIVQQIRALPGERRKVTLALNAPRPVGISRMSQGVVIHGPGATS